MPGLTEVLGLRESPSWLQETASSTWVNSVGFVWECSDWNLKRR